MPSVAEAAAWIDARVEQLAIDAGARICDAPPTIAGAVLARCDYFASFPGVAIAADAAGTEFFTPAACYHVYAALEGHRLERGAITTLVADCGRDEPGSEIETGRLRRFTMREVVFAGAPEWVSGMRDRWMAHGHALASSMGLSGTMEPATDTFFGAPGRGRRLLQQVKGLKYELRMDVGAAVLAVASFNLHDAFFADRFDIRMADGSMAVSGCAAFGLERWALAYLAHGHADLR